MSSPDESRFDPRLYVDREEHQDQLRQMILKQSEIRALFVSDVSGQGKSDLLLRLRLNCLENQPRAAVLLTDLRDLTTPFSAVERAYRNDQNVDTYADHFAEFCAVYERWSSTASVRFDGSPGADIVVEANNARVGPNASVIGQVVTATAPGVDNRPAQLESLRAFDNDLRSAHDLPLVLLIDHYNRAELPVRTWIDEKLLRPCLLGELDNVLVVLASTPDTKPSYAPELDRFVTCQPLARLEEDPVRVENLLRAHGLLFDDSPDYFVTLAVDVLSGGKEISDLMSFFPLLNRLAVPNGG